MILVASSVGTGTVLDTRGCGRIRGTARGTAVTVLPSVTDANSFASGMSEVNQIVGRSLIPDGTATDTVATLWDIDETGQITVTDLNNVVDSRWTLLHGVRQQ